MAGVTAAAVVTEIDQAFPDRTGMSLVPDHRTKLEGILGTLERIREAELAVLPDAGLERLERAVAALRSYVRAWASAGERERLLLAQPAFSTEYLEELRSLCATAAQASERLRGLTGGIVKLLGDFDQLPGPSDEGRRAYFLRWTDRVSDWLKEQIGHAEAERFSNTLLLAGANNEAAAGDHLKALREEIARDPGKYESTSPGGTVSAAAATPIDGTAALSPAEPALGASPSGRSLTLKRVLLPMKRVLLVFTSIGVGVYLERRGHIDALELAFSSNRVQFAVATVVAALGAEFVGSEADRRFWRIPLWLALVALLLGASWVAYLTFPAGTPTASQPTSVVGLPASPTQPVLQTDPFRIIKAVLSDSQLVKGPWRIVTPQHTLPLTTEDARRLDALLGPDQAFVPKHDHTIHVVENVGVELQGLGGPVAPDSKVYGALRSPWGTYHCAETFTYSPDTHEWSATINVGPGPWTFYVLIATTNEARDVLDVWVQETRYTRARADEPALPGRGAGVLTKGTFRIVSESFGPPLHDRHLTTGEGSTSLMASPGSP